MTRLACAAFAALLALSFAAPAYAHHDHWGGWGHGSGFALGVGIGACCGYSPYYAPSYAYPDYGYPAYVEAPPTTVIYEQAPAPVTYVMPSAPVMISPPPAQPVAVAPSPEIFTDKKGRTCRHFASMVDDAPVKGTVCLHADGSWHTVNE